MSDVGMKFPGVDESVCIGFRSFKSKAGKNCTMITVMKQCSDRDNNFGAFGYSVQDIFVPDSYAGTVNNNCIGKLVELGYDIVGAKAYVKSVAFH